MTCIWCDLISKRAEHETLIREMGSGYLYLHPNQIFRGRCLYIFKHHIEDFTLLNDQAFADVSKELLIVSRALKIVFEPALLNLATLGNNVRHLHWHVIPRYVTDPNWGGPPWPHGTLTVSKEECREMCGLINEAIKGDVGER